MNHTVVLKGICGVCILITLCIVISYDKEASLF